MANLQNVSEIKRKVYVLSDENVSLRTLTPQMVTDAYVNWMNDYEVTKFTEQKFLTHTIEGVRDFVLTKLNSGTDVLFGVFYNTKHIGNIKLGRINFDHQVSDISYFIGDKEFWGKGIATLIICSVVRIAFNDLGLVKVTAGSYCNNVASIKALEKNGFVLEGTRCKQIFFEGNRIDSLIYGKLIEDSQ